MAAKNNELSDRVKKKFGIDVTSYLEQALRNNGQIFRSEYKMLWQVMNPRECTTFLNEILTKFIVALESGKTNAADVGVAIEALLNTIAFVSLHQEFQTTDAKIKKNLEMWTKAEQTKNISAALPAAKDVIRLLTLRVDGTDMIGPLIIGCSTMHSVNEFQKLSDIVQFPTVDESDVRSAESVFIYPYLKNLCAKNSTTNNKLVTIMQSTFNKMLTLPQQMKVNPKVAETTFCALLHMLKSFLSVSSLSDPTILKSSLAVLQQFYLWPLPFGQMTKEMLIKLNQEFMFPGHFLRSKLFDEIQSIDYSTINGDCKAPLFYFINKDEESTIGYMQTLELKLFRGISRYDYPNRDRDLPVLLTPTLQASILLNMFFNEYGNADNELKQLKSITNAADLAILFKKLLQLIKDIADRPEAAKDIRSRSIAALRSSLSDIASRSRPGGNTELIKFPEGFTAPYTPIFPSYEHLLIAERITYTFHVKDNDFEDDWPTTNHAMMLKTILEGWLTDGAVSSVFGEKQTIRFVLAGGDELMHSFLCSYLKIRTSKPHLLEAVRPEFFILPSGKNGVAGFLARHDSWYNRHVYVPFRSPSFLIPSVRPDLDKIENDKSDDPVSAPGVFLRSLVENYIREADTVVPLSVYRCEAWQSASSKKDCDQLIPFVQRCEVGIIGRSGVGSTKYEVKVDDNVVPPEIQVKFIKMDLIGRMSEPILDDGAPYQSIVLANVPRKNDANFPPNPTSPYLELHAKLHKSFQKSAQKRNLLSNDNRQHVIEADLQCVTSSQQFSVLLDGQLFGPFYRIKITPIVDERDKEPINFPVKTFFPLDL